MKRRTRPEQEGVEEESEMPVVSEPVGNGEIGLPDQPMVPLRGMITMCNRHGRSLDLTDLKKWLRLNKSVFKVEKVDVLATDRSIHLLPELLVLAEEDGLSLSLRMAGRALPGILSALARAKLHDVFLCPLEPLADPCDAWRDVCRDAGLPVRAQVLFPCGASFDAGAVADRLDAADSVNIAYHDPFVDTPSYATREDGLSAIRQMNNLVRALDERGIEANLLHLPFCHVDEANKPHAMNSQQFFLDHQQYQRTSYEFAVKAFARGPHFIGKAVENLLARRTSVHNAIDNALFPWLLDKPRLYARVWMFHKLTRHLRFLSREPRPLPETVDAAEAEAEWLRRRNQRARGPICGACRFQRICDGESAVFQRHFPAVRVASVPGEMVVSPLSCAAVRKRHYDMLDARRRRLPEHKRMLAEEARRITLREPPTREISTDGYEIDGHFTHHMPGAVRWLSFANIKYQSTVLTRLEPPFTMALTFGGGIAEQIGFSFGRHAKILCPMIDYSHRLTLHVDRDGDYVLLRDNALVRPTDFDGARHVPPRLAGCLEPRIDIYNIDGMILTQTLLLWESPSRPAETLSPVKYSVIIISTRYTRRLQAALTALVHQQGIDMDQIEVVIGYVPGIDATDDLIDSMREAYPCLRIVRSPFAEAYARAKGFIINESVQVASGEWVILLDADIIVPPDLFARIEMVAEGAHFIAPDGRKMLSPKMTAEILLGKIRPWEDFEALAAAEPMFRFREADRVPIGFCQCVRRDILKEIPYHELDHFESSDWVFGREVVLRHGKEIRLEGVVVLHLDHSGSQWYGTPKHM